MSQRPVYGYPCVENPHDFDPDPECCSPTEIDTWRTACANWGKPSYQPNKGCFTQYGEDGTMVAHITRTSWGIGVNLIAHCDDCGECLCETPMVCYECGGWQEFCAVCWPKHEKWHEEGGGL